MLATPPFQFLINRIQIWAGGLSDSSPGALIDQLHSLVAEVPAAMSPPEQLLATAVLCQMLLGIARRCGLENHRRIVGAIVSMNEPKRSDDWRGAWMRATESCARVFAMTPCDDRPWAVSGQKTAVMLDILDAQFRDPGLSVKGLATAVDLSPSHTVRLLKRSTGLGLTQHLWARRIAYAKQLLAMTALSVKEVANASGSSHTSHFCRQFKRACGVTPIEYRTRRRQSNGRVTMTRSS
jgi:AraC-like DNA-binding protein